MTFVPADWFEDDREFEANILASAEERLARVFIGSDDEDGSVYSILVALSMVPGKPDSHCELIFNVVETTKDGNDIFHKDGLETKRFLSGDHRNRVRECICSVVSALVNREQPDVVSMCTLVAHLPEKALAKYGYVCKALTGIGYKGGKVDSYHGNEMWIMAKK